MAPFFTWWADFLIDHARRKSQLNRGTNVISGVTAEAVITLAAPSPPAPPPPGGRGAALAAGDGSNNQKRLGAFGHRLGQRGVRRLMGQVLLAGEEAQERPALEGDVIADRPPQHGIAGLEGVEHRALRDRALDLERHLARDLRQGAQVGREYYSDHSGAYLLNAICGKRG